MLKSSLVIQLSFAMEKVLPMELMTAIPRMMKDLLDPEVILVLFSSFELSIDCFTRQEEKSWMPL